ncbi:MAG: monovalent cation/H(+) antiporter subunit G [Chloroflexota bacterium]
MIAEIISLILLLTGIVFVLIAGIGVVRMPDIFLRMSSSTKAATLGLMLILIGTAVYFRDVGIASRAIATAIFVFLTAPVSAHLIGRAAYSDGVKLWEKTQLDELKDKYTTDETTRESVPE